MLIKIIDRKKTLVFNCRTHWQNGALIDPKKPDEVKRLRARIVRGVEGIGYTYEGNKESPK